VAFASTMGQGALLNISTHPTSLRKNGDFDTIHKNATLLFLKKIANLCRKVSNRHMYMNVNINEHT
jgi:hypothetical protein